MATGLEDVDALARFADALVVDVFDAIGVERGHIAATSFGGYMGIRSAAAHPDRVDSLMLFGFPVGAPTGKTPLTMRIGSVPWVVSDVMDSAERTNRQGDAQASDWEALDAGRYLGDDRLFGRCC
jgi:pimeloyl-ACP methyl ester carboxylesterase